MSISEAELIGRIVNWIREHMQTNVAENLAITADTDLLETGLLDSLGFVDLIVFINTQDGCKVDLSDVDPGEFAMVRGLCKIALRDRR